MVQLSLIPALEASRFAPAIQAAASHRASSHGASSHGASGQAHQSAMAPANRPTTAQVSYLKKLTRIRTDAQLARYVSRKLDKGEATAIKTTLTRHDFAKVIDMEVSEKRWAC
jgi:hypothetical protein